MSREPSSTPAGGRLRLIVWALPVVFGIVVAVRGAWLCDDIFVSFRYVDHWLDGAGLVFNPGERVEGYTHFLWVVLLAAGARAGLDLLELGRYLPVVAWVALLAVLWGHAVRESRQHAGHPWLALPVAAWGLALHRDAQIYASSGLETSFFALLLVLGVLFVAGRRPRLELGAVVYALATLVRPEGALYAASAGLLVLARQRGLRALGRPAAIWLALVLPFVAWKTWYYGTPIPNTYYAKSAALPYWSQGWIYTKLYFSIYAVLVLCLALALGLWIATRRRSRDPAQGPDLLLLLLVQSALSILYVGRVGGDFMFARFYIPMTPLVYLAAEEGLRRMRRPAWSAALGVLVVAGTLAARLPRDRIFVGADRVHGITDEPSNYSPDALRDLARQGEVLHRLLGDTGGRIVLPPGRTMVGYFGQLPYVIEGSGLTDAEIARQPLTVRGRPGHEKGPSDELLRRRRVPLVLLWGGHRAAALPVWERLVADGVYCRIVYYDRPLLDALRRKPGVQFIDFPQLLDQYLGRVAEVPADQLRKDAADFQQFYFDFNADPERRARLEAALRAAGGTR